MLPIWHMSIGLAFTILVWLAIPQIPFLYLILIFLSSVLIDFDHYAVSVSKTGSISIRKSFDYHNKKRIEEKRDISKGIKKRGDFHIFHTMEFHFLIGLLSLFWIGFFYIFIGMIFHSFLDLIDLIIKKRFHRREYFFFNWIRKKI